MASVQARRRDPLGSTVFALSRFPAAIFNEAVVGSAGQGEVVDVGVSAVGPVLGGVVYLAPVDGDVAAGVSAPAFGGMTA